MDVLTIPPAPARGRQMAAALAALDPDLSVEKLRPQLLALLKAVLEEGRAAIRERFEKGATGKDTIVAHCQLVDDLIVALLDVTVTRVFPLANPTEGERLGEGLDVFVQSFAPKPAMFVFGAIDFSAALVRVGKLLGFRVTVVDARPVFATAKRFPEADEVVVDWPHRWLSGQQVDSRTVIAVLTDRKSTRLNSSHSQQSRMPSSA